MDVLVTGAAGFIGSRFARQLAQAGYSVTAVDCFLGESYSAETKYANARELETSPGIRFLPWDVRYRLPSEIWDDIRAVVNFAAMPGLSKSWQDFHLYESCNFSAVHVLLEAAVEHGVDHFVQISTSSVYGTLAAGSEGLPLNPSSPYGVTKLAGERLVAAYGESLGLPFSILRLFSVYGPGQRPDMAYHRFIDRLLKREEIVVFGDGQQTRSNTYVDDIVRAVIAVVEGRPCGGPLNVSGGASYGLLEVIEVIAELIGVAPRLRFEPAQPGDQLHTRGDSREFGRRYGWTPQMGLRAGLEAQVAWQSAVR